MSILDPLRSPRGSRRRAMVAVAGLLLAVTLSIVGAAGGPLAAAWIAAGVGIVAAVIAGTLVYLSRHARLRTLLPQANEAMRRADVSKLVGAAVAVMIDGYADAARDDQDGATLRRHVAKAAAHWEGLSERWLRPVSRGPVDDDADGAAHAPSRSRDFDPALVDFIREPARTSLDAAAWQVFLRDLCDVTTSFRDTRTIPTLARRIAAAFAETHRPAAGDEAVREGRAHLVLELIVLTGLLRGAASAVRAARSRRLSGLAKLLEDAKTRGQQLLTNLSGADEQDRAFAIKAFHGAVTEVAEFVEPVKQPATTQVATATPAKVEPRRATRPASPTATTQQSIDVRADTQTGEYFVVPELGGTDAERYAPEAPRTVADRPPVLASQLSSKFNEQFHALCKRLRLTAAKREDYSRAIPGFDLTPAREEAVEALNEIISDAQRGDADAAAAIVVGDPSAAGSYLLRRRDAKVEQLRALYDQILQANAQLASVSLVLGNLDQTQDALQQVVSGRPDDLDTTLRLAEVRHLQGQLEDAEKLARRVLELAAEDGHAHRAAAQTRLGQISRSRGDLDRAEDEFRKALMIAERAGSRDGVAAGYLNLGLLYMQRSDADRAAEMFRGAAAASEAAGPMRVRAAACGQLGQIYRAKGDVARAEQMLTAAADAYTAVEMPSAAAAQLNALGLIFKQRGDLERAESAFRRAASLNERAGAHEGLATNYGNLADVALARGDAPAAETMLRDAIDLFEKAGSREGVAAAYSKLGPVLHAKGATDAAIDVLEIALAIHEKTGHTDRQAQDHANLGLLFAERGDLRQAERSHEQALALQEELRQHRGSAVTLNNLGQLAERLGEHDKSEGLYRRALALHERHGGDDAELARVLTNLGNFLLARGHAKSAEEMLARAIAIHEKLGSLQGLAAAGGSLAGIYQQRGDLDRAEEMIRIAIDAMAKLGAEEGLAMAHVRLGAIFRSRGDLANAAEMFREAITIDTRRGAEAEVASNCGNLGMIYRSLGNFEQAEEMLHRALTIFEKLGRADSLAVTYAHLGTLAMERGHAPNARELWSKALELYTQLGKQDTVRSLRGRLEAIGGTTR